MYNHYLRYYTLDRCGQKDNGKDYHLCNLHEMETKVITKKIKRDKKDISVKLKIVIPISTGQKNYKNQNQRVLEDNVRSLIL